MDPRIDIGEMAQVVTTETEVNQILENSLKRNLSIDELKLLSFSNETQWPKIIKMASKVKELFFENKLYFYVPLYVSSYCVNDCLYCDYRRSNKQLYRKRLTRDEFKQEVTYLFGKGYKKKIELVSASDPWFPLSQFAEYVTYTKSLGTEEVFMNNRMLKPTEYKLLKGAGLDWSWLWVESYDEIYYGKYHPKGGEKPNFKRRMDSYDNAAEAELNIGLGVMLGLSHDWRFEILSTIAHGQYLKRQYNVKIEFGTPRFCRPSNAPITDTPYSEATQDDVFKLIIALYRLGIRDAFVDGSTRESIGMLRQLWCGGGNLTNPEVQTIPGGYTLNAKGTQFSHHSYSLEYFIS